MSYDAGHRENVASHRIADSLRTAILDGSYLPGARIRQEDVAARSGASRIPVREALRMLDSEGLVTLVANAGAWVTKLSLSECVETYLIRERLEPLLLRTSMPRLDAAAVERLGGLADEMEAGAGLDAFMRTDREFHLSSYGGAESSEMWQIIHRMWNTTQHYRREFTRLAARESWPGRYAHGAPPAARLHPQAGSGRRRAGAGDAHPPHATRAGEASRAFRLTRSVYYYWQRSGTGGSGPVRVAAVRYGWQRSGTGGSGPVRVAAVRYGWQRSGTGGSGPGRG